MATLHNFYLEFDKTGLAATNLVANEAHTLNNGESVRLIVPRFGAFYSDTLKVHLVDTQTQSRVLLEKDIHYVATEMLHKVTRVVAKSVCAVILILPATAGKDIQITYQALGGHDQVNRDVLLNAIDDLLVTTNAFDWDNIANKPKEFAPASHLHDALDLYGLEYTSSAIDQIKYAVTTGDDATNRALVTYLNKSSAGIVDESNDVSFERANVVTALTKSAEDTLKLLSQEIYDLNNKQALLAERLKLLHEKQIYFILLFGNNTLANVAALMCKKTFDQGAQIIDVPPLFSGLTHYLDSSDYDRVNGTWKNRVSGEVAFYAPTFAAPTYAPSQTRPNINVLKFTDVARLHAAAGAGVTVSKNSTLISVTESSAYKEKIRLCLLSGSERKIEIDTGATVATRYASADGGIVGLSARTALHARAEPFVNALALSQSVDETLCLNNAPYSSYKAPNNIDIHEPTFLDNGSYMSQIGGVSESQSGDLFMLMHWNRRLSNTELHAVLTYIKIKYQAEVNYLTNPEFAEELCNFSSELSADLDFTNRDSIAVTNVPITLLDTQNNYIGIESASMRDLSDYEKRYLFVLSKSTDLCFWSQAPVLDPYALYELKLNITYGVISPPSIRLKINGQWHPHSVVLDPTTSVKKNLTFIFMATQPNTTLELFNLNAATVGNSFGVDSLYLVRRTHTGAEEQ